LGCDCGDAKERARLSKRIYYIKHGRQGKGKEIQDVLKEDAFFEEVRDDARFKRLLG